jgi:hypothetical protein
MTREQLEHLIRAAATIVDDETIIVIGSQAILGQYPDAPASMRVSTEADLFPLHHPERADVIDGSIGELSPFHETFGYYAQGVGEETALLPEGWKDRLCLEVHDLLISKALAGREKDLRFLSDAAKHRMADPKILVSRLSSVATDSARRQMARSAIERTFQLG